MKKYYLDANNRFWGPLTEMPPDATKYYSFDVGCPGTVFMHDSYNRDFESYIEHYLPTLPTHPHAFTGQSRVVPEGEIRWEYEVMSGGKWQECTKDTYEFITEPDYRRRVATPIAEEGKEDINWNGNAVSDFEKQAFNVEGDQKQYITDYVAQPDKPRHIGFNDLVAAIEIAIAYRDFGVLSEVLKHVKVNHPHQSSDK